MKFHSKHCNSDQIIEIGGKTLNSTENSSNANWHSWNGHIKFVCTCKEHTILQIQSALASDYCI